VSLPLAILSRNRPILRGALLGLASIVQTVPGWRCSRCSIRCCSRLPRSR